MMIKRRKTKEESIEKKIKIGYTDRCKTAKDISKTIKKIIFLSSFFNPYSINKAFLIKDKLKNNNDTQINFNGGFFQKG